MGQRWGVFDTLPSVGSRVPRWQHGRRFSGWTMLAHREDDLQELKQRRDEHASETAVSESAPTQTDFFSSESPLLGGYGPFLLRAASDWDGVDAGFR